MSVVEMCAVPHRALVDSDGCSRNLLSKYDERSDGCGRMCLDGNDSWEITLSRHNGIRFSRTAVFVPI